MPCPRALSGCFETTGKAGAGASAWSRLQDNLQDLGHTVQAEIRSYPTPIAGCDQQFNYLLEKRDRIFADIHRIHQALSNGDIALATKIAQLSEYISPDIKMMLIDEVDRAPSDRP